MYFYRYAFAFHFFLIVASFSHATDYYVAGAGNDSNTGQGPTIAFQSISKLNSIAFLPGDRIFFEGGKTFSGTLYLDQRIVGDPQHPILISTFGNGNANLIPNKDEAAILIHDSQGYNISNFVISGVQSDGTRNIASGIHICSNNKNFPTGHITLSHIEISGFDGIDSNDSSFGDGILVDNIPGAAYVSDINIDNVNIHDNQQNGILTLSRTSDRIQNINITDSEVYRHFGNPISHINSGSGINLGKVSNALVENVKSYDNGKNDHANGGPVGIWAWSSDHVTFRNNQSFHNHTSGATDGGGYDFDGGVTDSLMENNLSWENDGSGFLLCGTDALGPVERNIIRNNRSINDGRKNSYAGLHAHGIVNNSSFENNFIMMYDPADSHGPVIKSDWWTGQNLRFQSNTYQIGEGTPLLDVNPNNVPEGLEQNEDGTYTGLAPQVNN